MRSFTALVDLVLPNRCAGCTAPGSAWCQTCAHSLAHPVPVTRPGLAHAYTLGAYQGAPRRAILAYKERGRRELARPLGRALARAIPTLTDPRAGPLTLVPAPSRPAAARQRGGQHMAAVARTCAVALRAAGVAAIVAQPLTLAPGTADSVGLDAPARAANLSGRLHATPGRHPPNTHTILVDDVITTGATATACVSALAAVGVPVHTVLSLTATA